MLAQVWSEVGSIPTFLEEELAREDSFLPPLPHELAASPCNRLTPSVAPRPENLRS